MQVGARVEEWIYTTLTGDATLAGLVGTRVYAGMAPQGATMPYVVFAMANNHDVMGLGGTRIMTDFTYRVEVVGRTDSYSTISPIADGIDTLLHKASGAAGEDGYVLACQRVQEIAHPEVRDGIAYRRMGAYWHIIAQ